MHAHGLVQRFIRSGASLLVTTAMLIACTPTPPPTKNPTSSARPSAQSTPSAAAADAEAATVGVDPAVVAEVRALCAPGPGKAVKKLPHVTIPAVTWPGVSVPEEQVGTRTVPAIEIPPVDVPATTGETGCIVTFDAPAGCLPAVAISAGWIPGYLIEGYSYLGIGSGTETVPPLQRDAHVVDGASVEQRCQVEKAGQYVASVYRRGLYRAEIHQAASYRAARQRPAVDNGGKSTEPVDIPLLSVPASSLPSVSVEAASLPARHVTEDVSAVEDDTLVAYAAPAAVLFEFNKSVLLPAAAQTLDVVLADAATKGFVGRVRVEGHTDDTGDEPTNQRLSEARAQAVADYLIDHGIAADRITVTGRGESAPAYPNDTDENRAKNRRVVIEFRQE